MKPRDINSGITFFYYSDLSTVRSFYEEILGFDVVDVQDWSIIYQVRGSCFFGIVDEEKGFCKLKKDNAVLLTLVVGDVEKWYEYLMNEDVQIETKPETKEDIDVKCFFLKDPAGYSIEIQEFTDSEKAKEFEPPLL